MLPSSQRSLDEVIQCAYLSYSFGRLNHDSFFKDMIRGDMCDKSDIAYKLNDMILVYEHDPAYYHPDNRDDCKKTLFREFKYSGSACSYRCIKITTSST